MKEIHVAFERRDVKEIKRGLTVEIQKQLIQEVGDAGLVLFQHYMHNSYKDNYTFPDKDAAEDLGWKITKVERTRRKLTHARWFFQESGRYSGGRKIFTTYLGKTKVFHALGLREVDQFEMMAIGKRVQEELGLTADGCLKSKDAEKLMRKYFVEAEKTSAPLRAVKFNGDIRKDLSVPDDLVEMDSLQV